MSRASKEEVELVQELRERLGDVLKTKEQQSQTYLLRWLRARDLNLDKAQAMIENSMKWREENDVDNVLDTGSDKWIKENYPFYIEGRDIDGRPVGEWPMGSWDLRKALDRGLEKELITHVNYVFESCLRAMREINKTRNSEDQISQITLIVDWDKYSYTQLVHFKSLQRILNMAATYEAHYPEVMFRVFFINCPSIFPLFMAMLKPIIAPKTIAKITCHSTKEEWEPLIRKCVSKDQLATFLGGTRE